MKSLNLKAVLALFVAAALVIFAQSCSKDLNNPQEAAQQLDKTAALIAPSGLVLANSHDDLKQRFIQRYDLNVQPDEMTIKDITYHETEEASLAVVNYSIDGEPTSALVPLSIAAEKGLYDNGEKVYVKDLDKSDKTLLVAGGESLTKNAPILVGPIAICGGTCRCGWTSSGSNSYDCGCSPPYAGSCSMTIIF